MNENHLKTAFKTHLKEVKNRKDGSGYTLSEWAEIFLAEYAFINCKPSAYEHYADNLYKHVLPALGDFQLNEITTGDVQRMLMEQSRCGNLRTGEGLSPKSLRNVRTSLGVCLSQAVSCGLIGSNPVAGTVLRKSMKPKVEIMEEAHMEKLMNFLYSDGNLMNAGIILAAEFALRRGEVCALRWRDYDGTYLTINETVKRLKSAKGGAKKTELVFCRAKTESSVRNLAVPPALQNYLSAQLERYRRMFGEPSPDDFIVFNSVGGMTDPDNLSHYFSDVLAGLGLPHVKFHSLRHTFASRAIEKGVDIDSVSGILGHSSVNTTAYYYLRPRQTGMNNAIFKLSGTSSAVPSKLPNIVRGREVQHRFTRRAGFDLMQGKEAAV